MISWRNLPSPYFDERFCTLTSVFAGLELINPKRFSRLSEVKVRRWTFLKFCAERAATNVESSPPEYLTAISSPSVPGGHASVLKLSAAVCVLGVVPVLPGKNVFRKALIRITGKVTARQISARVSRSSGRRSISLAMFPENLLIPTLSAPPAPAVSICPLACCLRTAGNVANAQWPYLPPPHRHEVPWRLIPAGCNCSPQLS